MVPRDVKTLLLYPPLTDPTSGYHSLSYLEAFARARGFTAIDLIDANIEALHFLAQPARVASLKAHATLLMERLGAQAQLNGVEQLDYSVAWLSQALTPDAVSQALAILKNRSDFYRIDRYYQAVDALSLWISLLSLQSFAGDLGGDFQHPARGRMNLYNIDDLIDPDLLQRCSGPFQPYYDAELLPQIARAQYELIGINVTYISQLPYALWLAQQIKTQLPSAFVVLGGTEVSDRFKYSPTIEHFQQTFHMVDACVIGEGESCFVHILNALAEGQLPKNASNLILHPRHRRAEAEDLSFLPVKIAYEDLAQIPTPDFRKLPLHKYLSPEPFVYYSPSRGCYWNKCTFCDYGLNFDSPTAPWRADPVEKIVADLRQIAEQATFIYFSVDVLAPAMLVKLAERIIAEGINMRWSAEIRLETYWSKERCELLKRSGCVCISVGFESGNQRILDLINKGTRPEQVLLTIQHFWEAGIGVQMMGFVGFPSETYDEAMDSIRFLQANRTYWTFGGLGFFVLTAGAIVARDPARFGITNVRPYVGDSLHQSLYYTDPVHEQQTQRDPEWQERLEKSMQELSGQWSRPFLGGTDTPHTLMYHNRYGTSVLQAVQSLGLPTYITADTVVRLNGVLATTPHGFRPTRLSEELHNVRKAAADEGRAVSYREVTAFLLGLQVKKQDTRHTYFIRSDGTFLELTEELYRLYNAIAQTANLGEALTMLADGEENLDNHLGLLNYSLQNRYLIIPSEQQSEGGAR